MLDDAQDLVGQTVGEYRILSVLGAGGMGVVYQGEHPVIGKRVAIKVLRPALTSNPEILARFVSEARAVNAIRHRGIVDIFSFGVLPSGAHYFVMEFLEGEGLDRIVRTRAPVALGLALQWGSEISDALAAAHQVHIVHRDIKPSNLFLVSGRRGRTYVKLLDFGIAKAEFLAEGATPRTRESILVGTPEYMAPEQVMGLPVTAATDVYALGAVLFELLTGKRPFLGENPMRTMWMHASEPVPSARALNPSLPAEVDELLWRMLAKDPGGRPASADLLREHLDALLQLCPTDPQLAPLGDEGSTPPPSGRARRVSSGELRAVSPSAPALGLPTVALADMPPADERLSGGPRPSVPGAVPASRAPVSAPASASASASAAAAAAAGTSQPDTAALARALRARRRRAAVVASALAGAACLLVAVPLWRSGRDAQARAAPSPGGPTTSVAAPDGSASATAAAPGPGPADERPHDGGPLPVAVMEAGPGPAGQDDGRQQDAGATLGVLAAPSHRLGRTARTPLDERGGAEAPRRGPTTAELLARVGRLEQRVARHEAKLGERDRLLRAFLDRARAAAESAATDEARRDAALLLDDLSEHLGR